MSETTFDNNGNSSLNAVVSIKNKKPRYFEFIIKKSLAVCALISVITTAAIIFILVNESSNFFKEV